jgi:hypothetical protein
LVLIASSSLLDLNASDILVALEAITSLELALEKFQGIVNCTGVVCDQNTFKFFVSHKEESMAGHVGINGVY